MTIQSMLYTLYTICGEGRKRRGGRGGREENRAGSDRERRRGGIGRGKERVRRDRAERSSGEGRENGKYSKLERRDSQL